MSRKLQLSREGHWLSVVERDGKITEWDMTDPPGEPITKEEMLDEKEESEEVLK